METHPNIINILKSICSKGIDQVYFATNKSAPPVLAFSVVFPRLTILIDGEYETQLELHRKTTRLQLKPGQAIFIPSNCWDIPDMHKTSRALHILFGKRHTGISLVTTGEEVHADKIALEHTPAGPEQKILDSILELHQLKTPYPAFNHLFLALISCYITKLEETDKTSGQATNLLFQEICIYIQEQFQTELTRDSVARQYDISPNHLSRLFRTNGHMKFCDYVNYVRINRAKFLLQNYDLPLYEIARRCGYSDAVYFCRIFKKLTKKTPKQYQGQLMVTHTPAAI